MKNRGFGILGASVALMLSVASADAAFVQGTCSLTDVTAAGADANVCLNFSGNVDNYGTPAGFENHINSNFGLLGTIDWDLNGKSDDAANSDNVGNLASGSLLAGNWSVSSAIAAYFVVTVKAADYFAAYLFTSGTGITGGTFSVAGVTTKVGGGRPAALSHINVYTSNYHPNNNVPAVPLPASLLLLMSGIGGLGVLGRFRRRRVA